MSRGEMAEHGGETSAYRTEAQRLQALTEQVVAETGARLVQVLDRNGRVLASTGKESASVVQVLDGIVRDAGGRGIVPEDDEKWEIWPEDGRGEHVELWYVAGRVCLVTAYDGADRRARMEVWTRTAADEISAMLGEVFVREDVVDDRGRIPPASRLH